MARPWEIPALARPHHAHPLGAGWWRGPAPDSAECTRALAERGVRLGPELPDGSRAYLLAREPAEDPLAAAPDLADPRERAGWIVARLGAACRAWSAAPPPPAFMAILNLTADSFSDGGELPDADSVLRVAHARAGEGAAWFDLGAESTRPGAAGVSDARQLDRLLPAIEAVRPLGVPISIDTRSAAVAEACLDEGTAMINDVSGLSDPAMAPLAARRGCRVVVMHMRGTPADMSSHGSYRLLLGEVLDELALRVAATLAAGVSPERILVDPGIGFAKSAEQSRLLVARLGAFRALGLPVLAGPSRKSFMAEALPGRGAAGRDGGTAGAAALCAAQGAAVLRLHRGGEIWDAVKVAHAVAAAKCGSFAPKGYTLREDLEASA